LEKAGNNEKVEASVVWFLLTASGRNEETTARVKRTVFNIISVIL